MATTPPDEGNVPARPFRDPAKTPPPLAHLLKAQTLPVSDVVPHAKAIGMRLKEVWHSNALVEVPFSSRLIGNPDTGVVHGGVITTILDHVSGIAVFCALEEPRMTATLDLRIDYMRPATTGKPIQAQAHCYRLTRTIAFVHGTAHNGDPSDPIATSAAAFMLQ